VAGERSDEVSAEEFFELAKRPEIGNVMTLGLRRDDGLGPSFEGIDNLMAQARSFFMARMWAEYQRTGKMPSEVKLNLGVAFGALTEKEKWTPWFDGRDTGPTAFDGQHRESGGKSLREIVDGE
jgi:hypothetical protein